METHGKEGCGRNVSLVQACLTMWTLSFGLVAKSFQKTMFHSSWGNFRGTIDYD